MNPRVWYVATYSGEINVEFFTDPLAYGRAIKAAERAHEAQGMASGESSYTFGEVEA